MKLWVIGSIYVLLTPAKFPLKSKLFRFVSTESELRCLKPLTTPCHRKVMINYAFTHAVMNHLDIDDEPAIIYRAYFIQMGMNCRKSLI